MQFKNFVLHRQYFSDPNSISALSGNILRGGYSSSKNIVIYKQYSYLGIGLIEEDEIDRGCLDILNGYLTERGCKMVVLEDKLFDSQK